ncbi:MAG: DEAD/DEAH box helicase [Candidatus Helarchaeota archaeon]
MVKLFKIQGLDLIYKGNNLIFPEYLREKMKYDGEINEYRIKPIYYEEFLKYCKENGISIIDIYKDLKLEELIDRKKFNLREYQVNAFREWERNNYKGVIVLATGTGKSYIGLEAIYRLQVKTLIIVPTLALVEQWKEKVKEELIISEENVGVWAGGKQELKDITITTYSSCAVHIKKLRRDRGLIIYDEVHHLPAESYRIAAEAVFAPYKLGLSATPERADDLHLDLKYLVGEIVFRLAPTDYDSNQIAEFEIYKINVKLTKEEREEYNRCMDNYTNYIRTHGIKMRSGRDFRKLVFRTGRDKSALEALRSRSRARQIAFNAQEKIQILEQLLRKHKDQKVIMFSEFNEIIEKIGKLFLIPVITHQTNSRERNEILKRFKDGLYTKIASSKVLDEGIDISDASIGIILSGSGQKRQSIQRLGRLLRPYRGESGMKKAILYELITINTIEKSTARRRVISDEK